MKMTVRKRSTMLLGLTVAACIVMANPLATFSDSAFATNHYTSLTPSYGNGGPANVTVGGGKVTIVVGVNATTGYSWRSAYVMCNWAKWNPATQGAISRISYKETATVQSSLGQVGVGLVLAQGAGSSVKYYRAWTPLNSAPGNQAVALNNLTAASFEELDPSFSSANGVNANSHPDLSSNGGPIQFGILRMKSARTGKAEARTTCEDWSVEVTPQ